MRIDLNANVGQAADPWLAGKAGARALPGAVSASPEADSAQLSTDRSQLQTLSAAVLQLPEIRQDKVAALAGQLQKGSYQVSPQQTAEALLSALTAQHAA
ncbi:MAG: flagellar biosynthesis anti-sigma factor FlgM [Terriglobales bacterium]